jgi:hypothetical protein
MSNTKSDLGLLKSISERKRYMESLISRRSFLRTNAIALGAVAVSGFKGLGNAIAVEQGNSRVYFTEDISVAGLLKIYSKINQGMVGKVGIKLHTGEPHGPNLLPIELVKGLQSRIPKSNIVECNVLYPSPRKTTKGHRETLKVNGFDFCQVDIMDEDGAVTLPIPGMREFLDAWLDPSLKQRPFAAGVHLTEIAVGKNLLNYDSLLVYTHFKGTIITPELKMAFMEDNKAPVTTPGRGKRQSALRVGESLSGFTLKKVEANRVVLTRNEEIMTVMLDDSKSPKTREGTGTGPGKPAQPPSAAGLPLPRPVQPGISPAEVGVPPMP